MTFQNTREFAQQLDAQDELKNYRNEFIFPQHEGKNVIYFTGNSLGLQPKSAKKYVDDVSENVNSDLVHAQGFYFGNNPEMSDEEVQLLCKLLKKD